MKILRKIIVFFINFISKINIKLAILLSSFVSTFLYKQKIISNFDGEDWIYRWNKSVMITDQPYYNPKGNEELILLFFFNYQPTHNDIIFNIGADNGTEMQTFCEKVGPQGKVYAIEPNPECCRRLRKLKNILNLNNLVILECAIGEKEKTVILSNLTNSSITGQIINEDVSNNKKHFKVAQKSFDKIIKQYEIKKIDYVKVNIEGYEANFLEGYKYLQPKVKNFCIGCHDFLSPPKKTFDIVKSWLIKNNYETNIYKKDKKLEIWEKYYIYGKSKSE